MFIFVLCVLQNWDPAFYLLMASCFVSALVSTICACACVCLCVHVYICVWCVCVKVQHVMIYVVIITLQLLTRLVINEFKTFKERISSYFKERNRYSMSMSSQL